MSNNKMVTGTIAYQTLKDLHGNFLNKKHKVLSSLMTKEETKSVWFELDTEMKHFLAEILIDPNVSGIRMYFIQYPERQIDMRDEIIPRNELDVNQLTIGLVTTKKEGETHPDYPESINEVKMLVTPPLNHGQLCPQKCN